MANNVLPARVGEVARAYSFSRLEPVTASAAFGSLVVERFLDGVVLLLFLVLAALSPGFPAAAALSGGTMGFAVSLVAAVMLAIVVMAALPRQLLRAAEWTARLLPGRLSGKVLAGLATFLEGIAIVRDPKLLFLAFAWTVFFWSWNVVSFWLGMLAFGIDTGIVSAFFVQAVIGFGVAIPAAPGFIGTFHASAKFALSDVYGVAEPSSLAFAFGYHFGGWIPITAIGLWYAWRLGLTLGDVETATERVEEEADEVLDAASAPRDG
jgi:uncharacterized protein (TIRG00374 family)